MKKAIFLAALLSVLLNGCGGGSDGSNALYPPAIPTNLAVKECTETDVTIQWADNADNESGYVIERSVNGGEYAIINSTDPDATEYTEALADDAVHSYRLYAFNSDGDSDITGEVSIKRPKAAKVDITTEAGGKIELTSLATITFPPDSFSSDESVIAIEGVMTDSVSLEKQPYLNFVSDIKYISIVDFTNKDLILQKNLKIVMNYDPELLAKINDEGKDGKAYLVSKGIITQEYADKMAITPADLDIYYFNVITSKWIKTNAVIDTALHTFALDASYLGIYCIGYSNSSKTGFSVEANPDLQQYMIDELNNSDNTESQDDAIAATKSASSCSTCTSSINSSMRETISDVYSGYHNGCTRCPEWMPLLDNVGHVQYDEDKEIIMTNVIEAFNGHDKKTLGCDFCTTPGDITDMLSGYKFKPACAKHDCCYRHGYGTYGYKQLICNLNFLADMWAISHNAHPLWGHASYTIPPWGPHVSYDYPKPWNLPLLLYTLDLAGAMFNAVSLASPASSVAAYELQPCFDYIGRDLNCSIPFIKNVEADKLNCEPGENVNLTSIPNNPEQRSLSYIWNATAGTIVNASSANITWTAPSSIADDTDVTITLLITDGINIIPSKTKTVKVLKPYTITYNANGADSGTAPATTVHDYYGSLHYIATNSGDLVKTGYYFARWNTKADGNGYEHYLGSFFIIGKCDKTFYAKWLPTYRCLYNGNTNTVGTAPFDAAYYKPGESVIVKENINLVKTGFYFAGWNTQADGNGSDIVGSFTIGNSDAVVYAKWIPTYTVTYNGNGQTTGDVPDDPGKYLQGASVTVSGNTGSLLKTGFNFIGWNTDQNGNGNDRAVGGTFTVGALDTILYAKWSAYPVTYNGNGNTSGVVPLDTVNHMMGDNVIVKYNTGGLARTGHTFQGWESGGTLYSEGQNFQLSSQNISLNAKWSVIPYTVTYNSMGGSVVSSQTVNYNSYAGTPVGTAPITTKSGFDFNGWYKESSCINAWNFSAEMVKENVTLYAKWALITVDYVSSTIGNLKYVPAGIFQRDADPANISIISLPFRMSQNLITRAQFLAIMGTDPSNLTYSSGSNDPVQGVSWYSAIAFCNKLSIAEGLSPVYSVVGVNFSSLAFTSIPLTSNATWDAAVSTLANSGYRLPTEMQYMWAAMGAMSDSRTSDIVSGVNTGGYNKGYAGSIEAGGAQFNINSYAWTNLNSSSKTHTVGSKFPNELGLYDMSGNVFEWSSDWSEAYPAGTLTDYAGATSGAYRVYRGGSFLFTSPACSLACRGLAGPWGRDYYYGFRVVRP